MKIAPVQSYRHVLPDHITDALESLALQVSNITLYVAGLPIFPQVFTRDSLLSAILFQDSKMLRDQLIFDALLQGSVRDPLTGEEPGKIFHEMPGQKIRKLSTEYNACDTTALFVYAHEVYYDLTGDDEFIGRQRKYIERAVEYILSHLSNNLFIEDPKFSGAERYALRVTYWKDSQVHNRDHGEPVYPVVYTLAHVQNMRALKSAAKILKANDLALKAQAMLDKLETLFNDKLQVYNIGIDQKGFLTGISSDALHMLYYLDPEDIPSARVKQIVEATRVLETKIGYRTLSPEDRYIDKLGTVEEGYHARTVWPFEQAYIHQGARKFGLENVRQVAERIIPQLTSFPELFVLDNNNIRAGGAMIQQWTIAAKYYFDSQ